VTSPGSTGELARLVRSERLLDRRYGYYAVKISHPARAGRRVRGVRGAGRFVVQLHAAAFFAVMFAQSAFGAANAVC
jgi:hypothetical protein